jgi:hypothetical protein
MGHQVRCVILPTNNMCAKRLIVSNGAAMYPNTFMMQELSRRYFDEVLDREDEGKQVELPSIYTFPRGIKAFTT